MSLIGTLHRSRHVGSTVAIEAKRTRADVAEGGQLSGLLYDRHHAPFAVQPFEMVKY
jgi:hypothetical protein